MFSVYVGIAFSFLTPLIMMSILICMSRKLVGWGEPPAPDEKAAPASDQAGGKGSTAKIGGNDVRDFGPGAVNGVLPSVQLHEPFQLLCWWICMSA